MSKIQKILDLAKKRGATPARILTEIRLGGWQNTGFSGTSATTENDRRGLVSVARKINDFKKSQYDTLFRRWSGQAVVRLPLP